MQRKFHFLIDLTPELWAWWRKQGEPPTLSELQEISDQISLEKSCEVQGRGLE